MISTCTSLALSAVSPTSLPDAINTSDAWVWNMQLYDTCIYTSYLKVENPHKSTDGLTRDYCDGKQFQKHPLSSVDSRALQIMVYYDDLETCNPLGSRATKHKLGNFKINISLSEISHNACV